MHTHAVLYLDAGGKLDWLFFRFGAMQRRSARPNPFYLRTYMVVAYVYMYNLRSKNDRRTEVSKEVSKKEWGEAMQKSHFQFRNLFSPPQQKATSSFSAIGKKLIGQVGSPLS